jgi:hypothetical protein
VDDDGVVVGRICHIRAARAGGPRYDATLSPAERHAFENLLLLCGPHHDTIDKDATSWPVERLIEAKAAHAADADSVAAAGGEERVIGQLIQNSSAYESGLAIGTIIAGRDVHVGDVHHHASPSVARPDQREVDVRTLGLLKEALEDTSFIRFLKEQDFGAGFMLARIAPGVDYCERPKTSQEFLDEELEAERRGLVEALQRAMTAVTTNTMQRAPSYEFMSLPKPHEFGGMAPGAAVEHYETLRTLMNETTTAAAAAYERFVRKARRKLAT